MSFTKDNTLNWVRNGIQKETIDSAFLAGWNFVCPNHRINNLNDVITLKKKERNELVTVFSKPYSAMNDSEKGKVVEDNKGSSLTTSQIRIAFGEMRKIQSNGYELSSFLMLKPKLAYAVKRHDKKGLDEFYKIFVWAYDAVETNKPAEAPKQFNNFMQIMESLLAYHKFHGGRE